MTDDVIRDFKLFGTMTAPVKRAAYSDRTAWLMAILADLAYEKFDEESDDNIVALAAELAGLTNQDAIEKRLKELQKTLAGLNIFPDDLKNRNAKIKAALKAGGFKLAGGNVFHKAATDTQGFVAYRRDTTGTGLAVICFRGTEKLKDWLTNTRIGREPIRDPKPGGGGSGPFTPLAPPSPLA